MEEDSETDVDEELTTGHNEDAGVEIQKPSGPGDWHGLRVAGEGHKLFMRLKEPPPAVLEPITNKTTDAQVAVLWGVPAGYANKVSMSSGTKVR